MTIYEIEQEVINFHNTYENNAKKYGYETRKDTKELDLDSPNGRTMIATVFEILQPYTEKIEKLEEENKILQIKNDEQKKQVNYYKAIIEKTINILQESNKE